MPRTRPPALAIALVLLAIRTAPAQIAPGAKSEPTPPKPAPAPPAPAPKADAKPAEPPAPAPPRIDDLKVLTAAESAKRARGSMFTGGAAGDRYGESVPWAELPAWRRASFYGVRSAAQTVVFVVDCSGSMADDGRLARAKIELRRSIIDLQAPQRFSVIFYDDEPIPMPGLALRSADVAGKDQFFAWLRLIQPDGGTDPRVALQMALGLNPDAIYLLSDGAFPEGTAESVAARNRKRVPIHCIDLAGGSAGDHLRRIARDSGGQYAARPAAP